MEYAGIWTMDHRGLDPKIKSHQREVISTQLTYIIKCRMNLNRQYVWIPKYGRLRSLKIHRIFTQEEDIVTYVTSRNCPRSSLAYSAHLSLSLSSLLRKSQPRPAFVTKKKPLSILPPLSLCLGARILSHARNWAARFVWRRGLRCVTATCKHFPIAYILNPLHQTLRLLF